MDYAKQLLKKEKVELKKYELMSQLFEMLCNQQEIRNVGKKAMTLINSLSGNVALVQYTSEKFQLISHLGDRETVEKSLEDKSLLKKVKETKKPYFNHLDSDGYDCYVALPILSKDDFLGALCIFKEQKISCWEEIYTLLYLMALVFKHYDIVEENKTHNIMDNITNLFNYRHFQDQLELEIQKSNRYLIPLSLVIVDIQNFRMINEKLGYEVGDEVLRQVGIVISKSCRKVDMPARLNSDTFAILLSNTDLKGSYILLNRIILSLKRHKFNINGNEFKVKIKASSTPFEIHQMSGGQFLDKGKENLKEYKPEEILKLIEE